MRGIYPPYSIKVRKRFGKADWMTEATEYGEAIYGESIFGSGSQQTLLTDFGAVDYGEAIYGDYNTTPVFEAYGIYQQRKCKEGVRTVRMKFYRPTNPRTEIQQANRQKMINAVLAWQNLTAEQKIQYNKRARGKHYSGYNLYLKEHLLSN